MKSRYTGLSQLSLMQYVSQYTKVRGELTKRRNPHIVRTFPKISPNPGGPGFGKYCKYQLIKFKPWVGEPSNSWNNEKETDEMFINTYNLFLMTDKFAKEYVFRYSDETDRVHEAQCGKTNGNDDDQSDDDQSVDDHHEEEKVDDWMLLCRINQQFQDARNQMSDNEAVDWFQEVRAAVPTDLLKESPGWIYSQRKEAEELGHQFQKDEQQPIIDPETLNEKQRLAYDIITSEIGDNPEPVHMIVCGTAGTGKTYLISAVKQVLGAQCVVTATTGIAAFSINGETLHSAAQLLIREYRELQGDSLQRLQVRLEGKSFLIVDEMSMIGHKMLSSLDNRLRAGTGKVDIPFGGMSVILMGDFGQLPPVGDRPMYVPGNGSVVSDHCHSLYLMFQSVIILDQVMRQAGDDLEAIAFRALLMRMRDGKVTEKDWKLLLEHSTTKVPLDQFTDAIRLYFDKKSVAEYNYTKLLELGQPVAKIQAKHSGRGASAATSDEAGGLEAVLFLSAKAEVMLTSNLWTEVGLCNGSLGTIEQIWFGENMGPPNLPEAVLVHFPSYSGPAFLGACPKCIPVPPKMFEWMADGRHLSRQQVPLRLRYAMTIHKSQGQTLTKAVVDLGKGERVAGCTFVATSRVRSIHDIVYLFIYLFI